MSYAENARLRFESEVLGHVSTPERDCAKCGSYEDHAAWHAQREKNAEWMKSLSGFSNGAELAEALGRFVNGCSADDAKEFAYTLARYEHRTLQQQVFALFLALLQEWANAGSNHDLRNEFTVTKSKEIMKLFCGTGVPLV